MDWMQAEVILYMKHLYEAECKVFTWNRAFGTERSKFLWNGLHLQGEVCENQKIDIAHHARYNIISTREGKLSCGRSGVKPGRAPHKTIENKNRKGEHKYENHMDRTFLL